MSDTDGIALLHVKNLGSVVAEWREGLTCGFPRLHNREGQDTDVGYPISLGQSGKTVMRIIFDSSCRIFQITQ
jgi:hypothetical protein